MNVRQKLEELGLTDDKLNIQSAVFDPEKNSLDLVFVYAEWNVLTDEQKQQITNICKDLITDVEINIKFKGAYVDDEILFGVLQSFLQQNYKALLSVFSPKTVSFKKKDKEITIELQCDKVTADMISSSSFPNELCAFMKKENFYKFVLRICPQQQDDVKNIEVKNIESGHSLTWALEQEKTLNKLEIGNVEYLWGKVIEQKPDFIKNIMGEESGEVTIAGVVSDFVESTYVKKSKDEEAEPVEGVKLSFKISDASGSLRVVLFPNEKDVEKLRAICDEKSLVLVGNLNSYKDSTSFRPKGISFCELLHNEIHYCYRSVNDDYLVVSPKPWAEVSQMDLFSLQANNISDYLKNNTIVMFDLETTGLDPESCTITEIGAVKIQNGKCTEYFQTLVNPKTPIPQEVVDKTHITDEMVASAPTIDEVMPDFYKFVNGAVLSAYNIGFDYAFLKNIGHGLRYKFDNERIDCLDVVRQKVASLSNYKLATVSKALNIELKNAHRALADALAAAKVFIKLM